MITRLKFSRSLLLEWLTFEPFDSADDEQAFWVQHDAQRFAMRRRFMGLGVIIFALVGILDVFAWPADAHTLLLTRGLTTVFMIAALVGFLKARTPDGREAAVMMYSISAIVGQIAMSLIVQEAGVVYYQFGLAASMIYGAEVIVPRFKTCMMLLGITVVAFLFTLPYTQSSPIIQAINSVIIAVVVLAGLIGTFERERIERAQAAIQAHLNTARAEAEAARDTALEANRAKDQFLASVSHELRTPLNAIVGFSDAMKNEIFGPIHTPQYREYVDHIHHSGGLLQASIGDLLDLSRIQASKLGWQEETFDLNAVIAKTAATCKLDAQKARISLRVRQMRSHVSVTGDATRLGQALINLVTNAIKFSDGGEVTISGAFHSDGAFAINVVDKGRGISPKKLEEVRNPFAQGHSDSGHKGGLGLGLAIVSGIMEHFEGRLDLVSEEGVGTTASLVFPKSRITQRPGNPMGAPMRGPRKPMDLTA